MYTCLVDALSAMLFLLLVYMKLAVLVKLDSVFDTVLGSKIDCASQDTDVPSRVQHEFRVLAKLDFVFDRVLGSKNRPCKP